MDMEDLATKTRKPYTITKQRQRWTADEHDKFLKAVKLYGRAWQRIEEHIGTKTAVQIRSHAQKFFTKLEKEAIVKGVPLGQARDIDIPPPRPKRKPNNPYPRKTSAGTTNSVPVEVKDGIFLKSASSSYSRKQIQDPEIDLHFEKPCKKTRGEDSFDEDNCLGILNLSQETSCTSLSSSSKSQLVTAQLTKQCVFRDYIPLVKETSKKGVTDEFCQKTDLEVNQKLDRTDASCTDLDDGMSGAPTLNNYSDVMDEEVIKGNIMKQPEDSRKQLKEELRLNQHYPRHIPVHVVESSSETCTQSVSHAIKHPSSAIHQVDMTLRTENILMNPHPTASATECSTISNQQSLSSVPAPLNLLTNNHNSCNTFVNTDMSKLIVSSLLQNPAAHAAASFVASLWPFTNVEAASDSTPCPSPSASAIAAATVMAASAWWAAHGLLPLCPPLHPGFSCIPAPAIPSSTDASQRLVPKEKKSKASPVEGQLLDRELPIGLEPKFSDGKSPPMSVSDNNKGESARSNNSGQEARASEQKSVPAAGLQESGKGGKKELVDRSSCGSNTPSSSDVETDMLEKCADGKDELKELNLNHWTSEPHNHRNRSTNIMNDSWKEVSQEGKIAFKALFSRERLPQSFSPPKCAEDYQLMKGGESDGNGEPLDLNCKAFVPCLDCQETEKAIISDKRDGNIDSGSGQISAGSAHENFRSCRTGFKPYKRCSVEAKDSGLTNDSSQSEGRDRKRLCLEGEAST